jgi:cobalt-zinc-cadmium efflux system protein
MAHAHDHHDHSHTPANYGHAFGIGIALNALFIAIEIIYGLKANSLALLADAGHNASDVLGLIVAWSAVWLTRRKPNARYTYGLQSSSILAALANAVFLLVAIGGIVWEAFQRIGHPEPVTGNMVMIVAGIGIVINGVTALLFMKGSKGDLNIRGAFLHMVTDAAVSLGVVISGLVILQTGFLWLDPAVSIAIALIIMFGTWGLLRDSVNLALHAVPTHIDATQVKTFLLQVKGVTQVHDLHIWAMSTTTVALSAHLLMPSGHPGDIFVNDLTHKLEHNFGIHHVTLQIEMGTAECALAPDHVV